jgi:hypothetical protein
MQSPGGALVLPPLENHEVENKWGRQRGSVDSLSKIGSFTSPLVPALRPYAAPHRMQGEVSAGTLTDRCRTIAGTRERGLQLSRQYPEE